MKAEKALPLSSPEASERPRLTTGVPFLLVHVACLGVFLVPFEAWYVGLAVGLYYVRMFGVTAGYHRYFSHRTFKTSRVFQFLLAWLAMSSGEKGVLCLAGPDLGRAHAAPARAGRPGALRLSG